MFMFRQEVEQNHPYVAHRRETYENRLGESTLQQPLLLLSELDSQYRDTLVIVASVSGYSPIEIHHTVTFTEYGLIASFTSQ